MAGTGSALVHGSMRSGAALGLLMQEMAPEKARDCSDPWGGEEARQASLSCPLCLPRLGEILGSLFATLSPKDVPPTLPLQRGGSWLSCGVAGGNAGGGGRLRAVMWAPYILKGKATSGDPLS